MNRDQLMEKVKNQMPERRWQHTLGVIDSAVELAHRYDADPIKADMAALLHDVAKYWPIHDQKHWIEQDGKALDLLQYSKPLWHAEAGAIYAEKEFGVTDPEIIGAIRYHTSGREQMTLLEKVVCLADYIEPGRQFPGVEDIRNLAKINLEKALLKSFDQTITFLMEKSEKIYPITVRARNELIEHISNT